MKKSSGSGKNLRLVYFVFLVSLFSALIFVVLFVFSINDAIVLDFLSLLTGAEIIKSGEGSNLYNLVTQRNYQQQLLDPYGYRIGGGNLNLLPYLNFPFLAVFFIPFTFLDFLLAFKIYVLILLLLLLTLSLIATKIFETIAPTSFWALIPFLYYPSIGAAFIGQTSIPLTLLIFLIYWKLIDKKIFLAGILSGFILLKIQYFIFIPFIVLLISEKKEYIKGVFISSITIIAASFFISGNFWNEYYYLLANAQKPEFGLLDSKMFTLYGSLKQLWPFSNLSFIELFNINASLYFVAILIYSRFIKKISFDHGFLAAVVLTMVFCLHGVDYDQALLLVPIYILINLIKVEKSNLNRNKWAILLLIFAPILIIIQKGVLAPFLLFGIIAVLFVGRTSWKLE